jgi:hypothetical protein
MSYERKNTHTYIYIYANALRAGPACLRTNTIHHALRNVRELHGLFPEVVQNEAHAVLQVLRRSRQETLQAEALLRRKTLRHRASDERGHLHVVSPRVHDHLFRHSCAEVVSILESCGVHSAGAASDTSIGGSGWKNTPCQANGRHRASRTFPQEGECGGYPNPRWYRFCFRSALRFEA